MNEFEGVYLKIDGDPTYWFVEDGERVALSTPAEMHDRGLRPIRTVSKKALESIPLKGSRKRKVWEEAPAPEEKES